MGSFPVPGNANDFSFPDTVCGYGDANLVWCDEVEGCRLWARQCERPVGGCVRAVHGVIYLHLDALPSAMKRGGSKLQVKKGYG